MILTHFPSPVENDALRHLAVEVIVFAQRPGNGWADVVIKLLGGIGVQVGHAQVLPISVLVSAVAGEINPEARADQLTFSQLKSRL